MDTSTDAEKLYGVPSHLNTSGAIGWIPERTFYISVAAFVLGTLPAYMTYHSLQPPVHAGLQTTLTSLGAALVVGLVPALLLSPFAVWFFDPPVEHGLMRWLAYRLGRKTYQTQHIKTLAKVSIQQHVITTAHGMCAILALPTVNLDLSSADGRRRHHSKFGHFIDGLSTHPFQFVIRTHMQSQYTAIERMRLHKNPFSRQLAVWLAEHYVNKHAIDRRRYMVIPANDVETLNDRVDSIRRSLAQAGLDAELLSDEAEVRDVLNDWWTWRPHAERLGAEHVTLGAQQLQSDGELISIFALSKVPNTISTNWWYPVTDGDLPVDVVMTCEQQDLALAKWRLDLRYNGLSSSNASPSRAIALEQIRQLRLGFETRVRPWNVQVLFVVRAQDQATLDRHCRRLRQQFKDLGGEVKLLRWEQMQAMQSAQPLCGPMLHYRTLYLESGTLARTTPLSASTLQMLDGVPWGFSRSTPILLTTAHMRTGKHFGWFGFTGSGKGFGLRCYLARRFFADHLRLFIWDADDATHEYAGRFMDFIGGVRIELNNLVDIETMEIDPRWEAVGFDVSGMDVQYLPQAFARIKLAVEKHVLAYPGPTAFVVDEAITLAEAPDQSGARALGDAVQRWRKYGIECHVVTQRVSDWFGTPTGRKIQGNLAVKWYGAQEDSEMSEIARRVNWSPEELDRVGSAGIGQGLLVAFGRRVWSDLYDHCAPFEVEAYHTDPVDKAELLPVHSDTLISTAFAGRNGAAVNG